MCYMQLPLVNVCYFRNLVFDFKSCFNDIFDCCIFQDTCKTSKVFIFIFFDKLFLSLYLLILQLQSCW